MRAAPETPGHFAPGRRLAQIPQPPDSARRGELPPGVPAQQICSAAPTTFCPTPVVPYPGLVMASVVLSRPGPFAHSSSVTLSHQPLCCAVSQVCHRREVLPRRGPRPRRRAQRAQWRARPRPQPAPRHGWAGGPACVSSVFVPQGASRHGWAGARWRDHLKQDSWISSIELLWAGLRAFPVGLQRTLRHRKGAAWRDQI